MELAHIFKPSKYEAENCLKLPIFLLNQKHGIRNGLEKHIQWSNSSGFEKTIFYSIYWYEGTYCIKVIDNFKATDIELTETSCNFGNSRYWFICPGLSEPCEKRVGVLYKPLYAENFACRHCHNLTYQSSKKSGNERTFSKTLTDLEEMRKKIKRNCYAGIATKRLRKYLKERDRTNTSMIAYAKDFRKKIKGI